MRNRLHDDEVMIRIDENTAIVGKANEEWIVMGVAKGASLREMKAKLRRWRKFTLKIVHEIITQKHLLKRLLLLVMKTQFGRSFKKK